jgi:hypothetical protein
MRNFSSFLFYLLTNDKNNDILYSKKGDDDMFWKRRKRLKSKCSHEWHYLKDDYIYINQGNCVDAEDACLIICVKCEKEELVYEEEWYTIKRRQEILNEYRN